MCQNERNTFTNRFFYELKTNSELRNKIKNKNNHFKWQKESQQKKKNENFPTFFVIVFFLSIKNNFSIFRISLEI